MSQSRNWVFTKQATEAEEQLWNIWQSGAAVFQDPFKWHEHERVRYTVYQIEKAPSTGKLHVQGLLCLKNGGRMSTIKNIIGGNPHLEICKSVKDAVKYCKKDESRFAGPWEHGEAPTSQGERTDLIKLFSDLKNGKSNLAILEEDPRASKFEKNIKFMRFELMKARSDRQGQGVKVYVFWGRTGLGKTYNAINTFCPEGDYYIADAPSSRGSKLWFDGYEGQRTLILDDFSSECCSIEYLKRLLDKYPMKIEVKGAYAWAAWTQVIITSNYPPREWYLQDPNKPYTTVDMEPLERRIYEIRKFVEQGIYEIEDFNGNTLSDARPFILPYIAPPPPLPSPLPVPHIDEPQLLIDDCNLINDDFL